MFLKAYVRKRQTVLCCILILSLFYILIIRRYFFYDLIDSRPSSVKIVLWTPTQTPLSQGQLARLRKIVDAMNRTNQRKTCLSMEGVEASDIANDWEHCEFSISRKHAEDADVIVFPMFTFGFQLYEDNRLLSDLPLKRASDKQIWIMYTRESPPYSKWKDPLRNLINWTMSYRKDSDLWTPYGLKIPINHNAGTIFIQNVTLHQWISGKSKLVAGVISRCLSNSKREELIGQMNATGITVDIFGGCGKAVCGRYSEKCSEFWRDLARQYKFYLAFENSICKDYITEKLWRSLRLGMVPVVYGGGNYALDAPPNSYIDVRNFSSAQSLMEYLKMLDGNQEAYAEYFKWRLDYVKDNGIFSRDWCVLCNAVHRKIRGDMPTRSKIYGNLKWWWEHDPITDFSVCSLPYKFSNNSNKL